MQSSRLRCALAIFAAALAVPALRAQGGTVDYARDVKPILARSCYACHGPKLQMSGLRLDTAAAILAGGKNGPIIVPGSSGRSRLMHALAGSEGAMRMPFEKPPLGADETARIAAWIDQGAKAPVREDAAGPDDDAGARRHWSFIPPARGALPEARKAGWARNPIDRFILAVLEREGIEPSAEADRVTLLRRVSLDLTGLPPTPEEIDAFVADKRPDAYENAVERLLASAHYGERWGRHWLDAARYADSNGYSIDGPREIWRYRDWVVGALNRDLPFDRFVIEQVAGDMLPDRTVEQHIATGFHRNTPFNQEGGIDLEQFRIDAVADRVNTVGSVFLGLTVGCARCHDHKFDPISQKEYFGLFAFLNNADEPVLELASPEEIARRKAIRPQLRLLEKELQEYQAAWLKRMTEEQRRAIPREILTILNLGADQRDPKQTQVLADFLSKQEIGLKERILTIDSLRKREPAYPTTLVLDERAKPRETFVHLGGDFTRRGQTVSPSVPAVLHPLETSGTPTRLDLARWLVDRRNPLLARVTVNRIWQHYFGSGLVETENDFGTQGAPPSHPEVLDWLALEFVERGWSLKAMHRLIVTSATYRQSSRARPELTSRDPRNRLLARQNRLRLDAEILRDATLASSGLLDRRVGGPPVFPPQPAGVFGFTQIPRVWSASSGPDRYRRALYTHFWRSAPYPALAVFDAPDAIAACTRRNRSTSPMQALTLLNDDAFVELAAGLAARVLDRRAPSDAERAAYAFRLAVGRSPTASERARLERLLAEQLQAFRAAPEDARKLVPASIAGTRDLPRLAAWTAVGRVLLNLDEFITRE